MAHLMGERVTIHPCALGEGEGSATIHVASREDSSSLLPLDRQRDLFHMDEIATFEVAVRRLDEVLPIGMPTPILLKIDVQGFEYEVLKGAHTFLKNVEWIYVEASFVELYEGQKLANEVSELLESYGFTMAAQHNTTFRNGKPVQADLLFVTGGQSVDRHS